MEGNLANNIREAMTAGEYTVVSSTRINQQALRPFLANYPDFIVIPEYNIVGTMNDVTEALEIIGLNEDEIRIILNRVMPNITGDRAVTNNAINKLRRYPFVFQPGLNARNRPLINKIQALPPGKVIDVSRIAGDGANTLVINAPGIRSTKKGSPNLPIVSDNFSGYFKALHMLPGGIEAYADELEQVRQMFYPNDDLFPEFAQLALIQEFRIYGNTTDQLTLQTMQPMLYPQVPQPQAIQTQAIQTQLPQVPRIQIPQAYQTTVPLAYTQAPQAYQTTVPLTYAQVPQVVQTRVPQVPRIQIHQDYQTTVPLTYTQAPQVRTVLTPTMLTRLPQ